jgi:PAS domain S-box-containing protein
MPLTTNHSTNSIVSQATGVVIFSLDQDFRYTSFSPQHQRIMKKIWDADIKIGESMLEFLSEPDRTKAKVNFNKALKGESFSKVEEYGDSLLSRSFWEDHYSPISDENGKIVGVLVFVLDVSDRQEFAKALQESNDRLALSVKAANIGIWEWNMITNEIVWSDEILAIYNLDDSFKNLTFEKSLKFVHSEDVEILKNDIERAIISKTQYITHHRVIPPDGIPRWIYGTGKILLDNHQPVKMIGTVIDITDRKKLEMEKSESVSLLQAAIESTADGILVVSNDGKISAFNKKFLSIFGMTEEEAKNQPDEVLVQKALSKILEPEKFQAKVKELYANPILESNVTIHLKDGTILHRFSTPQILGDQVVGRVWSFRNVTEQKKAELNLSKSEELYRTITDNMIDMVSQVDSEGNFVFLSPSHFTVLGHKPESLIGISMFHLVHPDDLPVIREKFKQSSANKITERAEFRYRKASGEYVWLSANGNIIINEHGDIEKMIISSRDITHRKENEQALHHRDQMLSALAEATGHLAIETNTWIGLKKAIEILGQKTEADRVYIFQNSTKTDGVYCSLKAEWNSGVAEPQIQNPNLQDFPYAAAPSLYKKLSEKKSFIKHVRLVEGEDFRNALLEQKIKSLIITPIHVQNKFWGFIGIDECKEEREITQAEFSILNSFALTVGASIERKQIEIENKDWQTRYELVSKASGQIVYDYYIPSRKIIWSENVLKEVGYSQAEVETIESWGELIHPEDRKEAFGLLEKANAEKTEYDITYRFLTKQKGYVYMWDRGFFMFNNQNKAYRMLGVMQNVTNEKLAEQELKDSEQRYRTLQEASFGGIALHKMGKIIDANKGLANMTGYEVNELIGMNGLNLIAEEFRAQVIEHIKNGYSLPYDVIGVKKDGSRYNIEIHGKNVPYKGETLRVTEFRDITERKESESKIIEQNTRLSIIAEDLKKKNDQLEEFTQIVSHNLRSPASNILALLDLYEKSSDPEEKTYLFKMLRESGNKILGNLTELNEVLKIRQNQDIEKQVLSFAETLQGIKNQLSARIAETKAVITSDFKNAPEIVYPNIYLESILMNLITNALKYQHPERTPQIHVSTQNLDGAIVMKVRDNGLGLDLKKYGNHIFKLRKTFHKHPESRGIGLFMIKNQIVAMGGEISIESELNIGTTFTVLLNKTQ